jgi:hypothetical protein
MARTPKPSQGVTVNPRRVDPEKNRYSPKQSSWQKILKISFFIFIFILVVGVFGLTYVAASTGFIKIPLLSHLFYQNPSPNHLVIAQELDSSAVKERVQSEVNAGKDSVEVYLTEGNLTSIIKTAELEEAKLTNSQVAILDDSKIEIFGQLSNSNIFITAVYNIGEINGGEFKIDNLAEFKIGQLKVPFSLINGKFISEEDIRNLTNISMIENALSNEDSGLQISDLRIENRKIIESVSLTNYQDSKNQDSERF